MCALTSQDRFIDSFPMFTPRFNSIQPAISESASSEVMFFWLCVMKMESRTMAQWTKAMCFCSITQIVLDVWKGMKMSPIYYVIAQQVREHAFLAITFQR